MTASLLLLARLKLTLMRRAFSRRSRLSSWLAFAALALASSPVWLSSATGAYWAARTLGPEGVAVPLLLVHLSWISGSVLFGSFAEGFDLRTLLRYPVSPRAAFAMNVVVAPLDFIALFLIAPLGAAVVGTAARAGLVVAAAVAVAAVLQLLITSALTLMVLAALGRYVRRDWTRALLGVFLGMAVAGAGLLTTRGGLQPGQLSRLLSVGGRHLLAPVVTLARWLPTTALPVNAVFAAGAGAWAKVAGWLLGAAALLLGLGEAGTRVAVREALNRQAPTTAAASVSGPARGPARARSLLQALARALGRLLPADVGVLLGRELRYFLRTPNVLVGLLTSSVFVFLLPRDQPFVVESRPVFLTMFCLVAMLNVSANQFGLDQAGVRFLFLLPVSPRRVLLAKNFACATLALVSAALCLPLLKLAHPQSDALTMLTTLAALVSALPVALTFGNWLSVRRPWRMSFRMGGSPPGAVLAACCQLLAIAVITALLVPPLLALPALLGGTLRVRWLTVASLALLAVFTWTIWSVMLTHSARALDRRRAWFIDRLARPHELG